nr:MAG TPA: head to tail adaptor [Caudoviricetes sp.]
MTTLEKVKLALRITASVFDVELNGLIQAAIADLMLAGVRADIKPDDPLIERAVITYCKANFGEADQYDRLKASYDEQKAQLMSATGYTDWGDSNAEVR